MPEEVSREDKNRVLHEWTGQLYVGSSIDGKHVPYMPDFYESEEASALLLEKMPDGLVLEKVSTTLATESYSNWIVHGVDPEAMFYDKDRKTAIAEAAYAFVMQNKHATNA